MWVTGGSAKGTRLKTLPRRSIRPTTSVVRHSVFSLLESRAADWGRVLDLYAGSGALGIEALSRGAGWADFVDQRKSCCDIIRANLEKIGERQRAHVYCCSVSKAISFLSDHYDIVFMDPPYSDPSVGVALTGLARSSLLAENATVVLCHSNRLVTNPEYDGLRLVTRRRHGDTHISIYQKEVQI
ncbi:MAG: 16S rRNA (guanine(966)-N(2))-methyltransferase RsmD [Dehalococcoidia bacterium]